MIEVLSKIFQKASGLLGIQWAPVDIPTSRRLQTLAISGLIFMALVMEFLSIYLYIQLLYSRVWYLGILYGVYMLNDIDVCNRGSRPSDWVRNWKWWRYYCDYFPIKLVKMAELDPNRNYLFASFPHGLLSLGAFGCFSTHAMNFEKLFPGMTCNMITLGGHFLVPLFREFPISLGMCSASRESLMYLLNPKKNKGKCAVIMVGGAAEALDAHPMEYKVILSRRKGFVRVAMMSGSPLVPVFSFGETDTFRPLNNPDNSLLRRFQERVKKIIGVSPMFPVGRGVFQYSYGVLPMRTLITTVVGAPLEVKKNLDPTEDEVDAVHAEFTQRLIDLFESEKSKYLKYHEDAHLVIT